MTGQDKRIFSRLRGLCLLGLIAIGSLARAQNVVISEFMAAGNETFPDEDGDPSDWLELHSLEIQPVDLGGYFLTDHTDLLTRWPLPSIEIPGGGYLLIFASGKDRRIPGAPLHTNFSLDQDGEFLALVAPDGRTIVDAYAPSYPRQRSGLSYGIGQTQELTILLADGADARLLVPRDDSEDLDWTDPGHDDANWIAVRSGIGYDLEEGDGQIDAGNFAPEGTASQSSTLGDFLPALALDGDLGNFTHTLSGQTPASWELNFPEERIIERIVLWNRISCCQSRLRDITVSILAGDGSVVWASELLNPENVLGDGLVNRGPEKLELDLLERAGRALRGQTIRVVRTPDPDRSGSDGEGNADEPDVLQLAEVEVFGREIISYRGLFRTDVEARIRGLNTTAYLRIPFDLDEAPEFDNLTLGMRHDDGFVAYLNGREIARRNAPSPTSWNSAATAERDDLAALSFERFVVTEHQDALRVGRNVLAVQALNVAADDPDFLCVAELTGSRVTDGAPVYFRNPSPGEVNDSAGVAGFVEDTKFSRDRGFYDVPFDLEISTATEGATIRYTTDGSLPGPERGTIYTGPIRIEGSTVLRAMAYRPGLEPTNVDTHTYIFLDEVVASSVMSKSITEDPSYGPLMRVALTDLPSFSIVTSSTFNSSTEVPASVELIREDGSSGFQEDAGVKYFGGNVTNFPKKNFRIYFRALYGARKLRFPLFEGQEHGIPAIERHDQLELRGGSHDMSQRGFYMSNRFTDDSMLDMGNLNPHGRFVHLYINGTYWGQYHLRERWNADMHAEYLGGKGDDYESIVGNRDVMPGPWPDPGRPYDGDGSTWAHVKSLRGDYEAVRQFVDLPNYIDFMILFMFGQSESEFRCVGPREAGTGFKFYLNDADGFTRDAGNRTTISASSQADGNGPGDLFRDLFLRGHPDYLTLLGDRIHKHYFNDGAMTPSRSRARILERAEQIRRSMIAESARWGFRTPASWEAAKNDYLNNVLPTRSATVVQQFRAAGFYPDVEAPSFSRYGGLIGDDFVLSMDAAAGEIFYTTDGTDPRLPGGGLAPEARRAGVKNVRVLLSAGADARILVPVDDSPGLEWTAPGFDDSSWHARRTGIGYERGSGFEDLLGADDGDLLFEKNASVYIRIPFSAEDPAGLSLLTLRMKYDDGFVAYLNGEKVASRFEPQVLTWNASATATHPDTEARVFEDIPLPGKVALLRPGSNLLAIHGLNTGSASPDMLILPQLELSDDSDGPRIGPGVTRVQARVRLGDDWSALTDASYVNATLRVTEIMYHPLDPTRESPYDADEFEFIELLNIGARPTPLPGLRLEGGVHFDFADGDIQELAPGEYLVVVENRTAFETRYGSQGIPVAGQYRGRLDNRSDTLRLESTSGVVVQEFSYFDSWLPATDGEGLSLVIDDPFDADLQSWNRPSGWHASDVVHGSPGSAESLLGGRRLAGDANGDSSVDVGDAVRLLILLFRGDATPLPCDGQDVSEGGNAILLDFNGDASVDVADVLHLLVHLYRAGPPHTLGTFCSRIEGCTDLCR